MQIAYHLSELWNKTKRGPFYETPCTYLVVLALKPQIYLLCLGLVKALASEIAGLGCIIDAAEYNIQPFKVTQGRWFWGQ